jgi:hypothetical protein
MMMTPWTLMQYEWHPYQKKRGSASKQRTDASFVKTRGTSLEIVRRRKVVSKEEAHLQLERTHHMCKRLRLRE